MSFITFANVSEEQITITCGDGHGGLQDFTVPNMSWVGVTNANCNDSSSVLQAMAYVQATWGFVCAPLLMPLNTSGVATGNTSIGMV